MNTEHIHNELYRNLMGNEAISTKLCLDKLPEVKGLSKQL